MPPENRRVVFISYSHKDSDFVNLFAAALLKYDLQIWKDSKDIRIGDNIPKSIYSGIKDASHFCCIVSASSVTSKWVEEELSFAKIRQLGDSGLHIVPVLIDDVEIPDYVKAYLCAHLEDRSLLITNPEFLRILKAFGTDLEEYSRNMVTGKKRQALLEACERLGDDLALFREMLGNFQSAYLEHEAAIANKAYDRPEDFPSLPFGSAPRITRATTHGSDYRISRARSDVVGILTPVKESASCIQGSVKVVRAAWDDADSSHSISPLLALLSDPLSDLSYISQTIADSADGQLEDKWWIREKLSSWLEHLSVADRSIGSAITLLRSWAAFDA